MRRPTSTVHIQLSKIIRFAIKAVDRPLVRIRMNVGLRGAQYVVAVSL